MATATPAVTSPEVLAAERRMRRAMRTITGDGWRQRLAPLAQYMADRRLVRARTDHGAALVLLDLETLQQALIRLLQRDPLQGYLVVRLAVENAAPHAVAAGLGIDGAHLVGALRDAVATLALEYEGVTFASAVQGPGLPATTRKGHRH